MLYNSNWSKPKDAFSLDSLISWLEKQPANGTYKYFNTRNCLLAQYFTAMGYHHVAVSPYSMTSDETGRRCLPPHFDDIACAGYPVSFGNFLRFLFGRGVTFGRALKVAQQYRFWV